MKLLLILLLLGCAHAQKTREQVVPELATALRTQNRAKLDELTAACQNNACELEMVERYEGKTLMQYAIDGGNPADIDLLTGHFGQMPDNEDSEGGVPLLTYALRQGKGHMWPELIAHSALINGEGKWQDMPMFEALVVRKDTALAALLVRSGYDTYTDLYPGRKQTALHYAASMNAVPLIQLLVENGADIEAWDKKKNSPLVYAVTYGDHLEALIALLEAGADPTNTTKYTLKEWAQHYGSKRCVQELIARKYFEGN